MREEGWREGREKCIDRERLRGDVREREKRDREEKNGEKERERNCSLCQRSTNVFSHDRLIHHKEPVKSRGLQNTSETRASLPLPSSLPDYTHRQTPRSWT